MSKVVADANGDADLPTLEMFASLLSKKEHRNQKITVLRMAVTCAIRENDNAVLRCSYVLIEELIKVRTVFPSAVSIRDVQSKVKMDFRYFTLLRLEKVTR